MFTNSIFILKQSVVSNHILADYLYDCLYIIQRLERFIVTTCIIIYPTRRIIIVRTCADNIC